VRVRSELASAKLTFVPRSSTARRTPNGEYPFLRRFLTHAKGQYPKPNREKWSILNTQIDEHGHAVHEDCEVAKLTLKTGTAPPRPVA
jgi:hypothetical protein